MRIGVAYMTTDEGPDPLAVAREVEAAGLESISIPDHTHIPVSRQTPYPLAPSGELPRPYYRTRDLVATLAGIAAVTDTLTLISAVCLVIQRDPIVTAKEMATIDRMSGGRLLFGVGPGWNLEEMRNHGTDPAERYAIMRERVEAIRAIWTQERTEYHGRHVDFDPIFLWPKPAQDPHPPVLVAGNGPTVLDRVLAYGDGWIPAPEPDTGALGERIAELQERAAAAGRGPIEVTLFWADPGQLDRYAEIGVDRCLVPLAEGPIEDVRAQLRSIAGPAAA